MSKFIDLNGKIFDKLTILNRVKNSKSGNAQWLCLCECGNNKFISGSDIIKGKTKSCGCIRKETTTKRNLKHGHSKRQNSSSIYMIWANIIQRCTNPKHIGYKNYGGRGIIVCDRWNPKRGGSFENFLEDMGERPLGLTIDRINNDKGYHKSNCRWRTIKEQSRNKRNNIFISFNGKTQCVTDWQTETGINLETIKYRIDHGWTPEEALTTLTRKNQKNV